jgi:hypothetical protein
MLAKMKASTISDGCMICTRLQTENRESHFMNVLPRQLNFRST